MWLVEFKYVNKLPIFYLLYHGSHILYSFLYPFLMVAGHHGKEKVCRVHNFLLDPVQHSEINNTGTDYNKYPVQGYLTGPVQVQQTSGLQPLKVQGVGWTIMAHFQACAKLGGWTEDEMGLCLAGQAQEYYIT